jgi:hypothetical protein
MRQGPAQEVGIGELDPERSLGAADARIARRLYASVNEGFTND